MVFVRHISGFCLRQNVRFELPPCNIPVFIFQFEFINSYLSLFYIGFYLKDMERLKEVRAFHGVHVSCPPLSVYQ